MKEYKGLIREKILKVCEGNTTFNKKKIHTALDAQEYIRKFYSDDIEIFESMFILLLNRQNNTIGYAKISQGGVAGTVIDNKIIAKYCVDTLASSCILAHNHPSGELKPSIQDKNVSIKIKECLKLLDVSVLDSLILTKEGYYSLADNGDF